MSAVVPFTGAPAPVDPPAAIAIEQGVLGAALTDVDAFDRIAQRLGPDDFTDHGCSLVFRAMSAMHDAGRPVDATTLAVVLDRSEKWAAAGYGSAVAFAEALGFFSASPQMVDAYIGEIASASASRDLIASARKIEAVAKKDISADAKLAEASAVVMELARSNNLVDSISSRDAAREAVALVMEMYERGGGLAGYSTGFRDLDHFTAGLQPSTLTILAARPSMGKTALALNLAAAVARQAPVHVFSLEMSAGALAQRMLAALGGVDMGAMRTGKIDHVQQANLQAGGVMLEQLPIRFDDHGGLSIEQLRARARMAARREPIGMVVVDYLTLVDGPGETQSLKVGAVAKGLKELAKELNCPVLALAQLNRGVEQRPNKRPTMADLRDSGEIEQAADLILFNYLDEKYDDESARRGILELIIGKQRNGETGTVFLKWEGRFQRFSNMDKAVPELKAPSAKREGKGFGGNYDVPE